MRLESCGSSLVSPLLAALLRPTKPVEKRYPRASSALAPGEPQPSTHSAKRALLPPLLYSRMTQPARRKNRAWNMVESISPVPVKICMTSQCWSKARFQSNNPPPALRYCCTAAGDAQPSRDQFPSSAVQQGTPPNPGTTARS